MSSESNSGVGGDIPRNSNNSPPQHSTGMREQQQEVNQQISDNNSGHGRG